MNELFNYWILTSSIELWRQLHNSGLLLSSIKATVWSALLCKYYPRILNQQWLELLSQKFPLLKPKQKPFWKLVNWHFHVIGRRFPSSQTHILQFSSFPHQGCEDLRRRAWWRISKRSYHGSACFLFVSFRETRILPLIIFLNWVSLIAGVSGKCKNSIVSHVSSRLLSFLLM